MGSSEMELYVKILITGGSFLLPQRLAAALAGNHDVVLTARSELDADALGHEFLRSDLGHDDATNELVRGMDAIVHSGQTDEDDSESERLDVAMRCTYNLLMAVAAERVARVIYLGSLGILGKYDEDMTVTEFVCREFGRERKASVVCLRLGDLVWDGGDPGEANSSALYLDDAVQAVEKALSAGEHGAGPAARSQALGKPSWNIFHIQSSVPKARFATGAAETHLGYSPAARS